MGSFRSATAMLKGLSAKEQNIGFLQGYSDKPRLELLNLLKADRQHWAEASFKLFLDQAFQLKHMITD